MTAAQLISVQVGTPRTVGTRGSTDPMDRRFTSAIWKTPVRGPVRVARLGLEGDAVANRRVHGGAEQAVLMYAASHYPLWESEWGRPLEPGAFGENLSVEGLAEDSVCIGDVLEIGEARLWYLRVLGEGRLEAGQPVRRAERPHPEWTVRRAATVMLARGGDREAAALAACPALSPGWRARLAKA